MKVRSWSLGVGLVLAMGLLTFGGNPTAKQGPANAKVPDQKPALFAPPPLSPLAHTREALAKPTVLDFQGTRLGEAIEQTAKSSGLNIEFHNESIKEHGVDLNSPVTFQMKNVSLRSGLYWLLRSAHLAFDVTRDGTVAISGGGRLEYIREVYAVRDLVTTKNEFGEPAEDYESLIEVVKSSVGSHHWDDVGGPGMIKEVLGMIAVDQSEEIQMRIVHLLASLRATKTAVEANSATDPIWLNTTEYENAALARINKALQQPLDIDFNQTPFSDVIDYFRVNIPVPIHIDEQALKDSGIDIHSPQTVQLRGLPAGKCFEHFLKTYKLCFTVVDEVIWITTYDEACKRTTARVYPIGDLLIRASQGDTPSRAVQNDIANGKVLAEDFARTVQAIVRPPSWVNIGGPGSISYFPPARSLIVHQTHEVHNEIEQFLTDLRTKLKEQPRPAEKKRDPNELTTVIFRAVGLPASSRYIGNGPELSATDVVTIIKSELGEKIWKEPGVFIQTEQPTPVATVTQTIIVRHNEVVLREIRHIMTKQGVWTDPPKEKPEELKKIAVPAVGPSFFNPPGGGGGAQF